MLAVVESERAVQEGDLIGELQKWVSNSFVQSSIYPVRGAPLETFLTLNLQAPHLYRYAYAS